MGSGTETPSTLRPGAETVTDDPDARVIDTLVSVTVIDTTVPETLRVLPPTLTTVVVNVALLYAASANEGTTIAPRAMSPNIFFMVGYGRTAQKLKEFTPVAVDAPVPAPASQPRL